MSTFVENPFTKRKIVAGGHTHQLVQKILAEPGSFEQHRQAYLKAIHATKKAKYSSVPDQYFCGESGGYPPGTHTFPVDSEKRCRAALSYARVAPNPEGIRQCALKIATEKGWNCGKYSKAHGKATSNTAPKKMTGYQLFVKGELPKLKSTGITGKAAIIEAAKIWKTLPQKTKDAYSQEAKKLLTF